MGLEDDWSKKTTYQDYLCKDELGRRRQGEGQGSKQLPAQVFMVLVAKANLYSLS
jgi:hypothetical protein